MCGTCRRDMFILEPLHVLSSMSAGQTSAESCKRRGRGDLRSSIRPETWKRFEDGLQRNGFYEGELEGSKRYREKTAMAEVRCQSTWHGITALVCTVPMTDSRHLLRSRVRLTTRVDGVHDAVCAMALRPWFCLILGPPIDQPRRLLALLARRTKHVVVFNIPSTIHDIQLRCLSSPERPLLSPISQMPPAIRKG